MMDECATYWHCASAALLRGASLGREPEPPQPTVGLLRSAHAAHFAHPLAVGAEHHGLRRAGLRGHESAGGDHSTVPDGESLDIETGRLVAGGTLCANAGDRNGVGLEGPELAAELLGRVRFEPRIAPRQQEEPRLLWDQVRERDVRQHAQSAH